MNAPTAALDVALFRGESAAELLTITMIEPWPHNPRRSIDPAHLIELADSISKVGVLQPILVRPIGAMFSIVSGERRFRAAKRAGLEHIPAVVRTLTDAEALEIAVTENLQREDVPPLDEAEGYERLHQAHGYTIEEIADKVGKSKTYVYSRLKLTSLCAEAREYLRDGKLTPTVALLVARIPTPSEQVAAAIHLAADYHGRPLSATQAADYIRRTYMLRLADARFPTDDADLVAAAGACGACPKRTGCAPELFGDIDEADTCTDATCYQGKARAHMERLAAAHEAEGGTVIRDAEARKIWTFGQHLGGAYVGLDTPCHYDINGGRRTWAEIAALAKKPPAIVLVEGRDEWVRGIDRKAAEKMLVKLGIVEEEEVDDEDRTTPATRDDGYHVGDDWQLMREQEQALYDSILTVTQASEPSVLVLRVIVRCLVYGGNMHKLVARSIYETNLKYRRTDGVDVVVDANGNVSDPWSYLAALSDELDVPGLKHLATALALAELLEDRSSTKILSAIARDLGLDTERICERVKADIEHERTEAEAKIAEPAKTKKPRKKKAATTEEPSDA
jgi:ParB/RepB/Spo0J family partition protein